MALDCATDLPQPLKLCQCFKFTLQKTEIVIIDIGVPLIDLKAE